MGDRSDDVVRHPGLVLGTKYDADADVVFTDRTSMYFETSPNSVIRFGYSRDHGSDRSRVNVGSSMDRDSGKPMGSTMMPGDVSDVTHFRNTFERISPLLNGDSAMVFDNGTHSKKNSDLPEGNGIGSIAGSELDKSGIGYVENHQSEWSMADDGIMCIERTGYPGGRGHIFFLKHRLEFLDRYRSSVEHDCDGMGRMRLALEFGMKPCRKHRNDNRFAGTHPSYQFQPKGMDRDSAIWIAVRDMITGGEGLSTLMSDRPFPPSRISELYRSRNPVETAFRDLKHGMDRGPSDFNKSSAIKGGTSVSFPALFRMSMVGFLYPGFRHLSAESMTEQLTSFPLTLRRHRDGSEDGIFSDFCPMIRYLRRLKSSFSFRNSSTQTSTTSFAA